MSKLSLQVLVVTMKQSKGDYSLLEKMNIQSDALVGNQCDRFEKEHIDYKEHSVDWYSWDERGVGLNRNNLLMRATADIVLFADDDVIYDKGYVDIVLQAFEEHPESDGITFNVVPMPDTINPDLNKTWHRIRWYNCLKYGAPRLALRMKMLREKNIYYSLLFGGGAKYSSGEDSLFIADCLRNGMKIYGCPKRIGHVTFDSSSWYVGYTEKYFKDKGLFFYFLSKRFSPLLCLQYCIRKKDLFRDACTAKKAFKLMLKGIEEYRKG